MVAMQAQHVEAGQAGLFYGWDTSVAGAFVAGRTEEEARERLLIARIAVLDGSAPPEDHSLHRAPGGNLITVPEPEWQDPEQRAETIARLNAEFQRVVGTAGMA